MAGLDDLCGCGCVRACHRRAMEWGQAVYLACRHCAGCPRFGADVPSAAAVVPVAVLAAYPAWACLTHGADCGLATTGVCDLVAVTVTLTARGDR